MNKNLCPECGTEIIGRSDKKFCSDYCRNTYNNKLRQDSNNFVRNVNNILRKNRRILENLCPEGKANVHRDKLNQKGFQFDYHTNILKTKGGKQYVFSYDYGYLQTDDNWFVVVKKN